MTKLDLIKFLLEGDDGQKAQKDCTQQNNLNIERVFLGKVCMFRTYSAGVHFGKLIEKDGQCCLVENARRVWYWKQAATLSQLSQEGSKDIEGCKIAMVVPRMILEQVIEIMIMSDDAISNLYGAKEWKN